MAEATSEAIGLVDIADRIAQASNGGRVSVGDVISAIGQRAFGPLLLVFALIALSPIGAIPGASIVTGALIILVSIQIIMGRQTPWFPARLTQISVGSGKARSSVDRIKPYLAKVDKLISQRWRQLLRPLSVRVVALLCIVLAATMYPLAIVPGGVAAPAFAIVILSLGLASHDGMILAIGIICSIAALGLSVYLLL